MIVRLIKGAHTVRNRTKPIILMLIILVCFMASPANVLALSEDYTIIKHEHVPIPQTYKYISSINTVMDSKKGNKFLNQPSDLFINQEGYLFVADTGNNRIVKMTRTGETTGIFTGPADKPLNAPEGIFADENGNMFIADTGNARIVHLSIVPGQII